MIRRRFLRSSAILASSISSLIPHGAAKAESGRELIKRLREPMLASATFNPVAVGRGADDPPLKRAARFPWKTGIVTTTFWIGEKPAGNNPVPNRASSWDDHWAKNYGGTDEPNRGKRVNFLPPDFVPKQNPFYVALPYNDVTKGEPKLEAAAVVPWFHEARREPGKSVCKGRWVAIRFGPRIVYAQWEDCGPFRTDHWQYVFGTDRPKPNLNKGAGLDVSPAVRDYLGMADTDVTDWRFVEFADVPAGPWATHGDNNPFVLNKRSAEQNLANLLRQPLPGS